MRDKTANFSVGKNTDFENRRQPAILDMRQNHRFVMIHVANLGLSPKKYINETEIPQHKTTYFNFSGMVFLDFFPVHEKQRTGTTSSHCETGA